MPSIHSVFLSCAQPGRQGISPYCSTASGCTRSCPGLMPHLISVYVDLNPMHRRIVEILIEWVNGPIPPNNIRRCLDQVTGTDRAWLNMGFHAEIYLHKVTSG